jgi:class 3 adenylate cyclase/uncharacterized membrane protein
MKMAESIIKKITIVSVGAVLMFALMKYLAIPTGIPYTNINLGMAVLAVFAAIFGPVVGFFVGFIGHALVDLSYGEVWWSWVLASALFGAAVGSLRKVYNVSEKRFDLKRAVIFNAVQTAANILSYVFIARILDVVFYNQAFQKVTLQGFVAAGFNTAVILILGTVSLIVYSRYKIKEININENAAVEKKPVNLMEFVKSLALRFVLGLFFISAMLILIVSEVVNVQMANYEKTVTEMTQLHLKSAAQALTKLVSAEELDLFHTVEDMQKPEYRQIKEKLIKFGHDYDVFYAYYWRQYSDTKLQFIIDNDEDPATVVGPGTFQDIVNQAEFEALAGNVGVTDLGSYTSGWAGLMASFAPVYDSDGNLYAVAGVDAKDDFIFMQQKDARNMKLVQLIVIPISIFLGVFNMLLYRRKAKQIEEAHIKLQYFNNNMRRAFSTYLSEDVVEEIVSDPSRLQLGGENRHMTALFTDVKGFTGIAEALSPEQLVELLNYYLSTMSDVILEKEGTIDKYQGDAIVAFFGAPLDLPDHALRACLTAIIMKRLENDVNNHIAKNKLSPLPLLTRIGINSGDMVVGNMGTQKKMNYTIVSNAVNLASRLEGINKQYGTWILASEDTIKETHGKILARKLDRIRVVGINEPTQIYEIIDTTADATSAVKGKLDRFAEAYELFQERKWKSAENEFKKILTDHLDDGPSRLYLTRCQKFQQYPPTDDWDGVFSFKEK